MRLNRDLKAIHNRKTETDAAVTASVQAILTDVRENGDEAVRRYAEKFDGFTGGEWRVTEAEFEGALRDVGADFNRILHRAAAKIEAFHKNQEQRSWTTCRDDGVMMGQITRPLARVALYVPGGTAAYPSSVLMNAIPAQLAGVKDIAIFTPVKSDGKVPDAILAAAAVCNVRTVYKIGGAQAIAAAAYGTQTIPKADKIVGPGNIYVATAKRLVYGMADIDMVAGPSEILIIADETAEARYIAADLMSQAEHDELAGAVLITTSEKLIAETEAEIERQLPGLSRRDIIQKSLRDYGAAIHAASLDEAFAISNEIAPEHLEILTADPLSHLPKVQNAGSVFLGAYTPEPLGDYMSGPNHVLPTGGTAKFYSPLGVYDFVKHTSFSYYPRQALAELKDDTAKFARMEGLDAHANAVEVRFDPCVS